MKGAVDLYLIGVKNLKGYILSQQIVNDHIETWDYNRKEMGGNSLTGEMVHTSS